MRGLRLLQNTVEYNVLTTVNRINVDYQLKYIGFFAMILSRSGSIYSGGRVVVRANRRPPGKMSSVLGPVGPSEQFGRFLITILYEWVRKDVGIVFVQTCEAATRNWLGMASSGMCTPPRSEVRQTPYGSGRIETTSTRRCGRQGSRSRIATLIRCRSPTWIDAAIYTETRIVAGRCRFCCGRRRSLRAIRRS